jgi:hypothetical protein
MLCTQPNRPLLQSAEIISKIQFFYRREQSSHYCLLRRASAVRQTSCTTQLQRRPTRFIPQEHLSQTRIPDLHGGDYENYRYAPHNDVSVNDGTQIRRWSHNIIIPLCCGSGSSVVIATELRAGRSGDRIPLGQDFPMSRLALGPPSLLYNGYRVFPRG